MQINELKVGQNVRIIALSAGEKSYRHRLISLGLVPGTVFKIARIAPLGDPIEISVRGFVLSLRKHEASILKLEEI